MNITKLVEKAGVLECISYLSKSKEATKTELIHEVSACRQSVCDAIEQLVQAGFVSVRNERGFPWRMFHVLTPIGLELAHTPVDSLHIMERKWRQESGSQID